MFTPTGPLQRASDCARAQRIAVRTRARVALCSLVAAALVFPALGALNATVDAAYALNVPTVKKIKPNAGQERAVPRSISTAPASRERLRSGLARPTPPALW
jgi:hypothetical protein